MSDSKVERSSKARLTIDDDFCTCILCVCVCVCSMQAHVVSANKQKKTAGAG